MNMKSAVIAVCFAVQSFAGAFATEFTIHIAGQATTVETERFDVSRNEAGVAVFSGGDLLGESGEPQLPWKAMKVLLPPNTDMETVSCRMVSAEYRTLDGEWNVAPVPPILTRDRDGNEIEIWPSDKNIVAGRDTAIYSANALWPAEEVFLTGTGRLRSWRLAEIAVPLVRYNPVSGELQQLIRAELSVDFDKKGKSSKLATLSRNPKTGQRRGHDRARKLTVNFDDAAVVYEAGEDGAEPILQDAPASDGEILPLSPAGTSGYVIITTQDIRDNSTKLADFVAHKQNMGFTVTVVDEADLWGAGTPVAGDASATKLREWMQANYETMDLKYALIIGDPRVDQGYVPMKMYPCGGRDIPTDYFYAELTCDWDKDGDGIIGERGDEATSGDEIERYFEVYVGRIPHYGVMADTDAILQKTIDYETSTDTAWRRKVLISNVPLDSNTHGYDWGEQVKADLLEPKAISSDRAYRDRYDQSPSMHVIIPPPEFPASAYPATVWSQGQYGLHIWSTHGWTRSASDIISSGDAADLDDSHPATVFQGSCQNAWPEEVNNLSYALLKQGAILTLGATRNSYYYQQHEFSNTPTDCGMSYRYAKGISEEKSCGEALWGLKEEISSWWTHNWTLFNPYGDPSVVVMHPAPAFTITPTDAFYSSMDYAAGNSASRTYTLRNNSDSPLDWTASKSAIWFDLSASSGTIPAGGSTTVNIALNAQTANLNMDTHEASATFADTSNNITEERKVILAIGPNDSLRGYWKLDETDGTTADDQSAFENNGTLSGTNFSASVAGKYGNAIQLDGDDDHAKITGIKLSANTVTLTAWVRQGSTQNGWAGIVFDRSSSASGLSSDNGELRYHWNNGQWSWSSGLVPPADIWTFVALVVEPSKATIYMNSGSGFQTAVNNAPHAAALFGTTYIGWDPAQSGRHFEGAIDEVRIYNYSMSQAELQNVYEGGGAEGPNPFDGATGVESSVLKWSSGATAIAYDVYIGTNQTAVANATKVSPEYKRMAASAVFIATLSDTTQYYWRIDTVTASATLTGSVWSFTTGTVQDPGNIISIDFGSDTFSGGEMIGPLASDSTHWNDAGGDASGSLTDLIDNIGTTTSVEIQWQSKNTWGNGDGTSDDQHKLARRYLDDGNGVTVTINNIPYALYRVYGLFATDQNSSGSCGIVNFSINETWALGGSAATTALAWGSINANNTANGTYWTEIAPGTTQGNYWTVTSAGATCTIIGELKNGSNRGCLTGVIIEKIGGGPTNSPPVFTINQMSQPDAADGVAYGGILAGSATDDDSDPLTYSKFSGSVWLSIAPDGTLSGTPNDSDIGANIFVVRVSDGKGGSDTAILSITVTNVNEAPVFTVDPISGDRAVKNVAYSGTLAGGATDEDVGDTLTYSKVNGPGWLSVAGDGALSGTPNGGDLGLNVFEVRATDSSGLMDDATLNIEVYGDISIQTFHSTDIPVTINSASSGIINSTLAVNGVAGGILDVDVELDIAHTWDSDLLITLVAPDATEIILVENRGGSGDNFTGSVLDDSTTQAISEGSAPFTGGFRPEELLSGLNGKSANGDWTLRVADRASGDGGALEGWSLTITLPEDGDLDGMADVWERLYFANGIAALPDGNADADTQSNREEFIAGTNPTNAESYFSIENHAMSGANGFVVEWPSVADRLYTVRWTGSLTNSFQILEDNMEFPRGSYTDTVHHVDGRGFYEVDVRLK
jgi:subtilisin-like proprotein convertase family protein